MVESALIVLKDISSLLSTTETELQVFPIRCSCFHSEQGIRPAGSVLSDAENSILQYVESTVEI